MKTDKNQFDAVLSRMLRTAQFGLDLLGGLPPLCSFLMAEILL